MLIENCKIIMQRVYFAWLTSRYPEERAREILHALLELDDLCCSHEIVRSSILLMMTPDGVKKLEQYCRGGKLFGFVNASNFADKYFALKCYGVFLDERMKEIEEHASYFVLTRRWENLFYKYLCKEEIPIPLARHLAMCIGDADRNNELEKGHKYKIQVVHRAKDVESQFEKLCSTPGFIQQEVVEKGFFAEAIRYYILMLNNESLKSVYDVDCAAVERTWKAAVTTLPEIEMREYLTEQQIKYVDYRPFGKFWIAGDISLFVDAGKLNKMGYRFHYSREIGLREIGSPGWYLDEEIKVSATDEAIIKKTGKENAGEKEATCSCEHVEELKTPSKQKDVENADGTQGKVDDLDEQIVDDNGVDMQNSSSQEVTSATVKPSEQENEQQTKEKECPQIDNAENYPAVENTIIDLLKSKGLNYIDRRADGGSLWVLGDLDDLLIEMRSLKDVGYIFGYRKNGGGTTSFRKAWRLNSTPEGDTPTARLEPDLEKLLHGDELKFLRDALVYEEVLSIEEFRKLKMWQFMKNHNIYKDFNERMRIRSLIETRLSSLPPKHDHDKKAVSQSVEATSTKEIMQSASQSTKDTSAKQKTQPAAQNTQTVSRREVNEQLAPDEQDLVDARVTIRVGKMSFCGDVPAEAFAKFVQWLARSRPLSVRRKVGKRKDNEIVFGRNPHVQGSFVISNPTAYVRVDMTMEEVKKHIPWICRACRFDSSAIQINYDESKPISSTENEVGTQSHMTIERTKPKADTLAAQGGLEVGDKKKAHEEQMTVAVGQEFTQSVEQTVKEADYMGIKIDDVRMKLGCTMASLRTAIDASMQIVELENTLYHEDTFIEWEEGTTALERIVDKLLSRNNGYINVAQLMQYVNADEDMALFLSDNGLDTQDKIVDLMRHLFSKKHVHNKHLMISYGHISREEKPIRSNFDLICHYARENGGVFKEEELAAYLRSVGVKADQLRTQMQLRVNPSFFLMGDGLLISGESMNIDIAWVRKVREVLDRLFDDLSDHVVMRDIQPSWYDLLPELPGHRSWTPLLLQNVLAISSFRLGAKTIPATVGQNYETLHTMIVRKDSEIQTFPDAVIAVLVDDGVTQRDFRIEELRQLLVKRNLIGQNEVIGKQLYKALAKDSRFAWDHENQNVKIKV